MLDKLAPRERQIVDLLYAHGASTVADVRSALPVALSDQAIRAMLSRLEKKGFVERTDSDRGLLFSPSVPEAKAKQSALRQLVNVFFAGSPASAASALLGMSEKLKEEELEELERMLAEARKGQAK
jgi:predicted transcriptional regulator